MIDVYLAGPYTATGFYKQLTESTRYYLLTKYAAQIMAAELLVYSPITHSHPMTLHEALPGTWEYWERMDQIMMTVCKEIWVIKLEGWEESNGLKHELKLAGDWSVPVVFIDPTREAVAEAIDAYKVRMVSA